MGDVFIPPSLSNADAIAKAIPILSTLVNDRKSIESDIKSFHALNDTEAKKAQEARSTIKIHEQTLVEIKKTEAIVEKEKVDLQKAKSTFEQEKADEYQKIANAKLPANEALVKAQTLLDESKARQSDVALREEALEQAKKDHAKLVEAHLQKEKESAVERKKMDDQKKAILALDKAITDKLETLKKLNF